MEAQAAMFTEQLEHICRKTEALVRASIVLHCMSVITLTCIIGERAVFGQIGRPKTSTYIP